MSKYYLIRNLSNDLNEIWGYQKIKRYDSSYSVMMHFDDDIIKDEIPGNEWEIVGNPTLTTENSKFGKALLLDGRSKLILKNGLTLGGGTSQSTFGGTPQHYQEDTDGVFHLIQRIRLQVVDI